MAKTIFLSDNQVPGSSISATTGTTSAQFPLTNINTDATTNVARVETIAGEGDNIDIFSAIWTGNSFASNTAGNGLIRPSAGITFGDLAGGLASRFTIGFNDNTPTSQMTNIEGVVTKLNAGTGIFVKLDDGSNSFISRVTANAAAANPTIGTTFTLDAAITAPSSPLVNTIDWTVTFMEAEVVQLVKIVVQMSQDLSIDTIAVVGSNLDGLGYTSCVARHSLTTDFSTATDITVDLNQQYAFGYAFFTSAIARNVEFTFQNTGSFVEVSKIYIGARTEISATYSRESFSREIARNDEITENIIGNRFVNILNARDIITGVYPLLESPNFLTIESLFVKHGAYLPIWVMLDQENDLFTDGQFKLSMYSYFNNMFAHDLIGGGYFNVDIDLIEVV